MKKTSNSGGGIVALVILVSVAAGVNGFFRHTPGPLPTLIRQPYGIPTPMQPVNPFSSPSFGFTHSLPAAKTTPLPPRLPDGTEWSFQSSLSKSVAAPLAEQAREPAAPSSTHQLTQRTMPYGWNQWTRLHPFPGDAQNTDGHTSEHGK